MASLRKAKRRTTAPTKRAFSIPTSKVGRAARVVQDVAIKREITLSNSREVAPVSEIGHDRQAEKNQAKSHELVVQQKALVSGIDKQLTKLAAMNDVQKSTNSLADAKQRSMDWSTTESSKFSSSATTVLFPEDLKNIRKIIKEELALSGGSGGFGLPGMLPNKSGTPKPTPGTPTGGTPTPGAPSPTEKPNASKAIKIGSKFLKGSLGGAVLGGGMALYDSITESNQIEEEYRSGAISKEARDKKQKASNYRNGGKAIGSTLGAGLGALTGPLAFLAIPALSYLGGVAGGFAGERANDYFSKTPVASASEAMVNGSSVQMKDVNKKSTELSKDSKDAVDAITKVSEKFDIPKNEMLTTAMQESSLNPNSVPKTGAARGLFQFMPETWNNLIKKNKDIVAQYGIGEATISGKDDRLDPLKSSVMYALLRRENIQGLGKLTTGSTDVDLYIMHLFGAGRGKSVIKAYTTSPSDSIKKHIGADQYSANLEIVSRNGLALTVSEFVVNIAALLKRRGADVRKKTENMDSSDGAAKTGSEGSTDVRKGVDAQSSSNAAGGANTGSGVGADKANGDKVVINSGVRSNKTINGPSINAGTGAAGNIGKLTQSGINDEPAPRMDLRKRLNDERLMQTAAVNGGGSSGGTPIIINNQQSAPAQQSGMNSSPEKSASLSTRNNDSYYSAMKAIEMTRLS